MCTHTKHLIQSPSRGGADSALSVRPDEASKGVFGWLDTHRGNAGGAGCGQGVLPKGQRTGLKLFSGPPVCHSPFIPPCLLPFHHAARRASRPSHAHRISTERTGCRSRARARGRSSSGKWRTRSRHTTNLCWSIATPRFLRTAPCILTAPPHATAARTLNSPPHPPRAFMQHALSTAPRCGTEARPVHFSQVELKKKECIRQKEVGLPPPVPLLHPCCRFRAPPPHPHPFARHPSSSHLCLSRLDPFWGSD